MKECHDNSFSGGHFGRDKTLSRVQERFFWNGMTLDILKYVKNCEKCQRVNAKNIVEKPELHPIPVPMRLFNEEYKSLECTSRV